ncbi:MAG: acetyl-CoA C-acetyltransferase [bacterium]|nr:acetyl-CoA C-acetyltransferase [bacterium]
MSENVVIVAAGRTAIGTLGGSLSRIAASKLGATVISALLEKSGLAPEEIDEVVLGQVLTSGAGQNPARQSMRNASLPDSTPAFTINKVCGSGMKAINLARQSILLGDQDIMIAGGQESMSLSPHLLPGSRSGQKLGNWEMQDSLVNDGLWDAFYDCHMGITAENIADRFSITREQQDAFAATSQERALDAIKAGRFKDEIIPVTIPQRRGDPIVFEQDEGPRATTQEKLGGLRAVFKKDGSVTAGNASSINDGAAAVILMSEEKAKKKGLPVLARIKAFATAGVDPKIMGTGPVPASRACLDKAGWSVDDLDLIEANEAFAVQAAYVNQEMGFDPEKVNVNGGAIALGHPIGASGARIVVTLIHEMMKSDASKGLATMCIGGGMGVAMAIERG